MAENTKKKPIALAIVAALVIAVVAVLALRRSPPTLPVIRVAREDLSANVTSNGKVEPISPYVACGVPDVC